MLNPTFPKSASDRTKNLHLSHQKTQLTESEVRELSSAVQIDSRLNRFLPTRFFGSICAVFRK